MLRFFQTQIQFGHSSIRCSDGILERGNLVVEPRQSRAFFTELTLCLSEIVLKPSSFEFEAYMWNWYEMKVGGGMYRMKRRKKWTTDLCL